MTKTKLNPWADADQLRADKIWLQERLDVLTRENESLRVRLDKALVQLEDEQALENLLEMGVANAD